MAMSDTSGCYMLLKAQPIKGEVALQQDAKRVRAYLKWIHTAEPAAKSMLLGTLKLVSVSTTCVASG